MALRRETPHAHQGGDLRAGGLSPRPSGDVCAEPLRVEGSPETRLVPTSGAGPSQNGTCSGGGIGRKSRAARCNVFLFRFGKTKVSMTPVGMHRVEECVLWGQNLGKQSYHGAFRSGTCLGGGTYM